jgi:hypothetical protein
MNTFDFHRTQTHTFGTSLPNVVLQAGEIRSDGRAQEEMAV